MKKPHVILNLHGVGAPQREFEPGERPYWISEDRFREIVDLAVSLKNRGTCEFTIDDGNISDAKIAGPYLARCGFPTQIFVLTGRIGEAGSLDKEAIADLIDMGHSIGSHGHGHKDWRRLDDQGFVREIHTPREILEDLTSRSVPAAGIPFGSYNRRVLAEIRKAGFSRCYSSDGGVAKNGGWPIARHSVREDLSLEEVRKVLLADEPFVKRFQRRLKGKIKKRI